MLKRQGGMPETSSGKPRNKPSCLYVLSSFQHIFFYRICFDCLWAGFFCEADPLIGKQTFSYMFVCVRIVSLDLLIAGCAKQILQTPNERVLCIFLHVRPFCCRYLGKYGYKAGRDLREDPDHLRMLRFYQNSVKTWTKKCSQK